MELLIAPAPESALPIGGGEGAFCHDCGVLIMDEVSDGIDVPIPHGRLLVRCAIVRLFLQAKKEREGGRGVLRFLRRCYVQLTIGRLHE